MMSNYSKMEYCLGNAFEVLPAPTVSVIALVDYTRIIATHGWQRLNPLSSSLSFVDVFFFGGGGGAFGSISRFLLRNSKDILYIGFYRQHYIGDPDVV